MYPTYSFTIRPTFLQVKETLLGLLAIPLGGKALTLAVDVETIAIAKLDAAHKAIVKMARAKFFM